MVIYAKEWSEVQKSRDIFPRQTQKEKKRELKESAKRLFLN